MPNPTVTIATVTDSFAGFRSTGDPFPDGLYATVRLDWPEAPLPLKGDRVAVAGTVDAIFKWMETLPAKRIVAAARAWADMVDTLPSISHPPRMEARAQALYDAVRAAGTPSEDEAYEPPVIRDRPRSGRSTRRVGSTIVTITITEDA